MQLKINDYRDIIFEWIPYDKFDNIKEIGINSTNNNKNDSSITKTYFATFKDGPLYYRNIFWGYLRYIDAVVALKCFNINLQDEDAIDEFLNEILRNFTIKIFSNNIKIYGISQNPNTKEYIMVIHEGYFERYYKEYCIKCAEMYTNTNYNWCKPCLINYIKEDFIYWNSGKKEIDIFIQEMQLKINHHSDIVFEWIPYNRFNSIKEIGKGDFTTIYSAKWKDGPLSYNQHKKVYTRDSEMINLKCFDKSKYTIIEFLNKIENYTIKRDVAEVYNKYKRNVTKENNIKMYGISKDPKTKNYIVVLENQYFEKYCAKCDKNNDWCEQCQTNDLRKNFVNWSSGNEKIDGLIQEMQLKINSPSNIIFEWIPYNQFNGIKEIGKGGFAIVYSAIWNDGPLKYDTNRKEYTRISGTTIALKCLDNSQSITDEFINEVTLCD
ncbi:unnamed protein product [Rhizophagus irregularis]|nr:unnamed protein product [Rhizophagus irregularis]